MVGGTSMELKKEYDPRQEWLPFMKGTIFYIQAKSPLEPQPQVHRPVPAHKILAKHARMDDFGRVPYLYQKDIHQIQLPFAEFQRLSKKDHSRAEQAGYPGWERHNGQPLRVTFEKEHAEAVADWCKMNCTGRYHLKQQFAVFELASDYMMVRLGFQRAKK